MNPRDVWVMFMASVTSIQFHPGARREGREPLSLEECALVADRMMVLCAERWGDAVMQRDLPLRGN